MRVGAARAGQPRRDPPDPIRRPGSRPFRIDSMGVGGKPCATWREHAAHGRRVARLSRLFPVRACSGVGPSMNVSEPEAFPITWSDPSDVERSWRRDEMHSPFYLVPLSQDYVTLIGNGFGYRYERLDVPISMRALVVNGYLYFSWIPLGPESGHEAIVEQYVATCRE